MRKATLIRRPTRGTLGGTKFSRLRTTHGQPSHEDHSRSSGIELSRHSYGCTECHWLNASSTQKKPCQFRKSGIDHDCAPFRRGIGLEFTGGTEFATGWFLNRRSTQGCIITTVVPGSSVECDDEQHAGRGVRCAIVISPDEFPVLPVVYCYPQLRVHPRWNVYPN